MKQRDIIDYKLSQGDIVRQHSEKLRTQGYVKNYRDLYPDVYDRIHMQKGTAYIRGNIPLKLMAIIYDTIIVSVPPLSKKQLEKRFEIEWDEFIKLCDHNIVIPVIGNADYYTGKHFEPLFELSHPPCSLLARGLALLDVFGMDDTLSAAKDILPVDKIVADDSVWKSWKKRYPSANEKDVKQRIERDVALQYADLCIFGYKNEATDLANLPPKKLYETLKLMNEIRTYPVLFGMNSQANFNYQKLHNLSNFHVKESNFRPLVLPKKELEILYEGIGIDTSNIDVGSIIAYHNDSLGIKLRAALSSFNVYCDDKIRQQEALSASEVCTRAESFQKEFREAVKELDSRKYSKIDRTYKSITNFLKIGTVVLGSAVALNENTSQVVDILSVVGTAGALVASLPEETAELIVKLGLDRFDSKFVANMWAAKRIVDGK